MSAFDWLFGVAPIAIIALAMLWAAWGEWRETARSLDWLDKVCNDKQPPATPH